MPAPTNISFATAEDLGTLTLGVPVTLSAVADFGGAIFPLFYAFTAPVGATVVRVNGFGDVAVYQPLIQPYDAAQASILNISATNRPIQFPVTAGALHYVEIVPQGNVSPANLSLTIEAHETQAVPAGSIVVPDANNGFPAAILSATADYTVLRYLLGFSSSEQGDVLSTGVNLMQTDTNILTITLRDANFNTLAVLAAPDVVIRANVGLDLFYVAIDDGGANPIRVVTVDASGTMTAISTMTGVTNVETIAANNAGTILYHATSGAGVALKQWDLVNHVALADLVAAVAGNRITDILVLSDHTLLVAYTIGSPKTLTVKHYSAVGATLHTYTITTNGDSVTPRLASAVDSLSFWAWFAEPISGGTGKSHIQNIRIADGAVLIDRVNMSYGAGIWVGTPTASPPGTFGHDNSCPFWIIRTTPTITTVSTFRCEDSNPQTVTITGTDFPEDPIITVTDTRGDTYEATILLSSATSITFTSVFLRCGNWTFQVSGSNVFTVHVCKPAVPGLTGCWGNAADPNFATVELIHKDVQP